MSPKSTYASLCRLLAKLKIEYNESHEMTQVAGLYCEIKAVEQAIKWAEEQINAEHD